MNILVTGGAGFIGSHLTDAYLKMGHKVTIIDNLSTGDKSNLNTKAEFINTDIRSEQTREVIEKGDFQVISHHGAQIDVRLAVDNPVLDADINILGTINILEALKNKKNCRLIFASSGGAVYGEVDDANLPVREDFPINPLSPYGAGKHAIEHYLFLYNKLYNLDYVVLRYGNVYGERQAKKGEAGVISIFSRLMREKKKCIIFGDGKQLRDYIYVHDLVKANMMVSNRNIFPSKEITHFNDPVFNIGTGKGYSVLDLFNGLENFFKTDIEPQFDPPRQGEIYKTYVNTSKAQRILNWEPETDFYEGLLNTAKWFHDNPDY